MASRTCVVSFRDLDGLEHSVEVSASSLYEAAVLGLKAFRSSKFSDGVRPAKTTPLTVAVKSVETRHEVKISQLEDWLASGGKSPREQVLKDRLRRILRQAPAR